MDGDTTKRLDDWLDRLRSDEQKVVDQAFAEMVKHFIERLKARIGVMLGDFEEVAKKMEVDEVLNEIIMNLKADLMGLSARNPQPQPGTFHGKDFMTFASCRVRHKLVDLARYFRLRRTQGLKEEFIPASPGEVIFLEHIAEWERFHTKVGELRDDLREVFELRYYSDLNQGETAKCLGMGSKKAGSLWQEARIAIIDACDGEMPPGPPIPKGFSRESLEEIP